MTTKEEKQLPAKSTLIVLPETDKTSGYGDSLKVIGQYSEIKMTVSEILSLLEKQVITRSQAFQIIFKQERPNYFEGGSQ